MEIYIDISDQIAMGLGYMKKLDLCLFRGDSVLLQEFCSVLPLTKREKCLS